MSTTAVSAAVPAPELNVTPLIDVMLVLLTMLILTVPVVNHAVKLDLPGGPPAAPSPAVDLDVDADGRVFWNGTNVADDRQLEAQLRALAQQDPQPLLKIWPDRRSRYERVVQVMAAAQRSGVAHIGVAPTAQ